MNVIVVVTSLVLGGVAALTLRWMLYAWRSPDGLAATRFSRGEPTTTRRLRFSLLVPARHEEAVLAHTLAGLPGQDHPDLEVICHRRARRPGHGRVAHGRPPTAPRAGAGGRRPTRGRRTSPRR